MSAEPFATPTNDPFSSAEPIRFPNRADLPAFYGKPTPEFIEQAKSLIVTQNGKAVEPGFTLYEVAPERWYAVKEDGEIYTQREFELLHERAYIAYYRSRGQPAPDPYLRPIPNVHEFVAYKVDHTGKALEKILKPRFEEVEITAQYTQTGAVASPDALAASKPAGYDVKVSEGAATAPISAEANAVAAENAALREKVAELQRARDAMEKLMQHERMKTQRTTAPKGDLEAKKTRGATTLVMPCGREVDKRGAKTHGTHCEKCLPILIEAFGPLE